MPTPKSLYTKSILENLGYFATWMPGAGLALGDYGVLSGAALEYRGRLADLHIAFNDRIDPSPRDLSHAVNSEVKFGSSLGAGTSGQLPPASGSVEVSFSSEGAYLFQAQGCQEQTIADQTDLEHQLRAAYDAGDWKREWVVVTEIVKAERATVLISNSEKAEVKLSVQGDLPAGAVSLAGGRAHLAVAGQSGDVTKVLAEAGLTLLYRLARLRRRWLSTQTVFEGVSQPKALNPWVLERDALDGPVGGTGEERLVLERVSLAELQEPPAPR